MLSSSLGRPRRRRTPVLATLLTAAPLILVGGLGASPAHADDRTPFIVVGTSDVSDSQLMSKVIEPDFEAANPTIDLQYVGQATGAAITAAESGGAAAIVVHAPSLENQFVSAGYSAEPAGRAFSYNDFVLAGWPADPAGVTTGGVISHDTVAAFEAIAAAGAQGKANFSSRSGQPGTTVAEHQIWALTTGVTLCTVSDANGGGMSPSTTTGPCPDTITYPSWYHSANVKQAANIGLADACNSYTTSQNCYVFTDRGTFNYLQSTSALAHLVIVVRDNASSAPGGQYLLTNYFHAYAINPDKFTGANKTDLPTATKFLDFLTSPTEQDHIDTYLSEATAGDPPFRKDAAPQITLSPAPAQVNAGQSIDISGVVTNAAPGLPAISGKDVQLLARLTSSPDATPVVKATTTTGDSGQFEFVYKPNASLTYTVATGSITQVENATLQFSDILAPTSTEAGAVAVQAKVVLQKANRVGATKHSLQVSGSLLPAVIGSKAHLVLYLAKTGGTLAQSGAQSLAAGQTSYTKTFAVGAGLKGTYDYRIGYVNAGIVSPAMTRTYQVTFP